MNIQVKEYKSAKEFQKDAQKMLDAGWRIEGQTSGGGEVSVGGTAAKLALTGGLGAITGLSRKRTMITVTWANDDAQVESWQDRMNASSAKMRATSAKMKEALPARKAERKAQGFWGQVLHPTANVRQGLEAYEQAAKPEVAATTQEVTQQQPPPQAPASK